MSVQIAKRFSVSDYYRMAEIGILAEDDRVELIEGEVVEMSPVGSRHAGCVKRLNTLVSEQLGRRAVVSVQDPIRLDDYSEPEPDVALLRPREDFYAKGHPTAGDVLLIIEVAESSDRYDREAKAPIYARAGIPEMWVVSLSTDAVHQYANPLNGRYQKHDEFKRGESMSPVLLPDLTLEIGEILG
jgi:Uma2 family endonuclease